MFAKLKKKIQDEAQNVVGITDEKKPLKATSSGPGLASPVNKDYPGDERHTDSAPRGPFFSPSRHSEPDHADSDTPERNGSRASSVDSNSKDGTNKEEVLAMLMKRTEQVKKLEVKISELAVMLKDKNKQIDKLEGALDKQHDESLQELQQMTDKYHAERSKVAEGFSEAVNQKEHEIRLKVHKQLEALEKSRNELQNQLEKAEVYREKYYTAAENKDEMTNLTAQELAKVKHMLLNTQAELKTKDESLSVSDKQVADLQDEVSNLMGQISTLTKTSDESEETNKLLTRRLEESQASIEGAHTRLQQLEKQNAELEQIQQKYSDLSKKHEALSAHTEVERNKLTGELERRTEQATHLHERVSTLEKRLKDCQLSDDDQLQALEKERAALEVRLTEAREQLTEWKAKSGENITLLEQKIIHLNSKATEQTRELNKTKRSVDETRNTLQKEIDSWKSKLQMALLEVKDKEKLLDAQKQSQEQELARRHKGAALLEDELNEQIRQLKSQIDTIERAKERDKQTAHDRIAKLEGVQQDWLEREIDTERQITQLEEDLHNSKVEVAEKDKELVVLRRQLKQKDQQISSVELKYKEHTAQAKEHQEKAETSHKSAISLEKELQSCLKEKDDLLVRNAQLSQDFESHKRQMAKDLRELLHDVKQRDSAISGLEQSLSDLQQENAEYQQKVRELELQHGAVLEQVESDEINRLKQTLSNMEEQIADKNKSMKMLQQRLTDLKKTLQRELKVQTLPNDEGGGGMTPASSARDLSQITSSDAKSNDTNHQHSPPPPSIQVSQQGDVRKSHHRKSSNSTYSRPYAPNLRHHNIPQDTFYPQSSQKPASHVYYCDPKDFMQELNFEYLKHVVLKFMLSREHEAVHLIKAVAMLLHFTPDEQRLIKDTLDYKMSWFGTRPQLGGGQMAKVIPSTY